MRILGMVLAALLATASAVSAENFSENIATAFEDMQAKKKEKVVEILQLDEDTIDDFWDLYDEFQWALEKENEKYTEIVWEYLDKSTEMTDERARAMVQTYLELEEEHARLRKAYLGKFGEILTPLQLVHLFQIENKADAIVKYRAATYIPMFE